MSIQLYKTVKQVFFFFAFSRRLLSFTGMTGCMKRNQSKKQNTTLQYFLFKSATAMKNQTKTVLLQNKPKYSLMIQAC